MSTKKHRSSKNNWRFYRELAYLERKVLQEATMPALTRAQEKREEAKKKEQYQEAFRVLKEILDSKEQKDMLEKTRIPLHEHGKGRGLLYLTRGGLLEVTGGSQTGIDGSPEYWHDEDYLDLSIELVQRYDLSAAEIRKVQKQLKA